MSGKVDTAKIEAVLWPHTGKSRLEFLEAKVTCHLPLALASGSAFSSILDLFIERGQAARGFGQCHGFAGSLAVPVRMLHVVGVWEEMGCNGHRWGKER